MIEVTWIALWSALEIFGCMLVAPELGYRLGVWLKSKGRIADLHQLPIIQGAILGLLGLLLGLSFAAAGWKFIDRQNLIAREANAIKTAFLRADLLEEPIRHQYRLVLKEYAFSRIKLFKSFGNEDLEKAARESAVLHLRMWSLATTAVRKAQKYEETVLPPLNEAIELHTLRIMAIHRYLPWSVIVLLELLAGAALLMVGYGNGMNGRRNFLLTTSLAALVASVLWLTLDLDYPRTGLLQINQRPMLELYEWMGK